MQSFTILFEKFLRVRDEHLKCVKITFFVSHVTLGILTVAFIGTGIGAISSNLFHKEMKSLHTKAID